jgi:hypothetical protein
LEDLQEWKLVWVEAIGRGKPSYYHLTIAGAIELVPGWADSSMQQKEDQAHPSNYHDLEIHTFDPIYQYILDDDRIWYEPLQDRRLRDWDSEHPGESFEDYRHRMGLTVQPA